MTFGETLAAGILYKKLRNIEKNTAHAVESRANGHEQYLDKSANTLNGDLTEIERKALRLLTVIILTSIGGFIFFACTFHFVLGTLCLLAVRFAWHMIKSIYADADNRNKIIRNS